MVSEADETIETIRRRAHQSSNAPAEVVGYGHRVSLGVVPDEDTIDLDGVAEGLAREAVLWHRSGCLLVRGVLVEGDRERCKRVARRLGPWLDTWEERLDAVPEDEGMQVQRARALSLADFRGVRCGEGFGWAELCEGPFEGQRVAPHVVTCHPLEGPDELEEAIDLDDARLQGVVPPDEGLSPETARRWKQALARCSATLVASPGSLQSPPPHWLHDGRLNVATWLRATTYAASSRPRSRDR